MVATRLHYRAAVVGQEAQDTHHILNESDNVGHGLAP